MSKLIDFFIFTDSIVSSQNVCVQGFIDSLNVCVPVPTFEIIVESVLKPSMDIFLSATNRC